MKKKNNKGFSLVELIIVIAIMVALIAVLAPSYVKYVQKSRTSAYENACEDFVASVKEAYADPDSGIHSACTFTIVKPSASVPFASCLIADDDVTTSTDVLSTLKARANTGTKKLQAVTGSASVYKVECKSDGTVNVTVTTE